MVNYNKIALFMVNWISCSEKGRYECEKKFEKMFAVAVAAAMVVTAMPMQPVQAAKVTTLAKAKRTKKVAVVTTQKELEAALKNPNVKKIKIKTEANVTFKIKEGDYGKLKVVVNAPNAKVQNKANGLQEIKVNNIAKWTEKGKGNNIVVSAAESNIVVKKNASVESISYKGEGAKAELKVKGNVEKVNVEKTLEIEVTGNTASVEIEVSKEAEGTTITATVTVEVKTEADIKVDLSEGAEGSSVTTTDETVKTEIKNETKEEVTVEGMEEPGTGDSGSETIPVTGITLTEKTVSGAAVTISGSAIKVTSGGAITTGSSITLTAKVAPSEATDRSIGWVVENNCSKVVSVKTDVDVVEITMLDAVSEEKTVTLTAKVGEFTQNFTITIKPNQS